MEFLNVVKLSHLHASSSVGAYTSIFMIQTAWTVYIYIYIYIQLLAVNAVESVNAMNNLQINWLLAVDESCRFAHGPERTFCFQVFTFKEIFIDFSAHMFVFCCLNHGLKIFEHEAQPSTRGFTSALSLLVFVRVVYDLR